MQRERERGGDGDERDGGDGGEDCDGIKRAWW